MAAQSGSLLTVDGAKQYTTTVHVDDAAQLYLLAVTKGKSGEVFNASSSTDVKAYDMFAAMARAIGVPLNDLTFDETVKQFGPIIAWFLKAENRASGDKARKELGWVPKGPGVLEDINNGSYQAVAGHLKKMKAQ
jgi:nucleoside-diphosphate-sugar epimerase